MSTLGERNDGGRPAVIETASATTSPDNATSGHTAYIIAAVTLVLLSVVGSGLAGCMGFAKDLIEDDITHDTSVYPPYEYNDDTDDLNNYLENPYGYDGFGYPEQDDGILTDGTKEVSVQDVLGADLSMYRDTVDSMLPAAAYANAQQPVRTFVRELVLVDRDASSEIANLLRSASWEGADVSSALADASARAQDTIGELQRMTFPETEGEHAGDISRSLEVGRGKAIDRWKAIADELELLSSSDTLVASQVGEADGVVAQNAQEAADAFVQALTDSASR